MFPQYRAPERFLQANPGLESRFSRTIEFANYAPSELVTIVENNCAARNLLGLHALGRLDPADELRVEQHSRQCAPCTRESEGLRQATAALDLLTSSDKAEIRAKGRVAPAPATACGSAVQHVDAPESVGDGADREWPVGRAEDRGDQ